MVNLNESFVKPKTPSNQVKQQQQQQQQEENIKFSLTKLTQFVSRSALKVAKSVTNLNNRNETCGSNGSSPAISMKSCEDDDDREEEEEVVVEIKHEIQNETKVICSQIEQTDLYFQYDQFPDLTNILYQQQKRHQQQSHPLVSNDLSSIHHPVVNTRMPPQNVTSSRINRSSERPTMGLMALTLKRIKQASVSMNQPSVTTIGVNLLPNIYLISAPIVFNSTDLLANEEYMSSCSASTSSSSSASSSSMFATAAQLSSYQSNYDHLSRISQQLSSTVASHVLQTPMRQQQHQQMLADSSKSSIKSILNTPLPSKPVHQQTPMHLNQQQQQPSNKMSVFAKPKSIINKNELTYDTINDSMF